MRTIHVLCIGSCKERYLREAIGEYQKRLSGFCKLLIHELPATRLPGKPSPSDIQKGLEQEGNRLLKQLPLGYCYVLCIEGKQLDSIAFATHMNQKAVEVFKQGKSCLDLVFIIGGSYGLSESVKQRGDYKLSLSGMTFPHQLTRVLLLEQIYRGFHIQSNGKYHK